MLVLEISFIWVSESNKSQKLMIDSKFLKNLKVKWLLLPKKIKKLKKEKKKGHLISIILAETKGRIPS